MNTDELAMMVNLEMNLDREWTGEEIEKFASKVNSCEDDMSVVNFMRGCVKHTSVSNCVRLHQEIKNRLVVAMSSPKYREFQRQLVLEQEQKAFVKQIKLPGEA